MRGCNELIVGLALAIAMPAQAQSALPAATVEVFPAGYFRSAAPANAGDMLERVPGFTLIEADADVRGYSGAAGNVLVDGARPTSKREETSQQLQRIPASAVARIELIRAGTPGVDMGGYPVLANIVLRHEAQATSTIEAGLLASTDGWSALQAEVQYTRRRDGRRLELAFAQEPELDDDTGDGTWDTLDWRTRTIKRKRSATAAWQQPLAAGQLALNAALRGERARVDTAIGGAGELERIAEGEDARESELGARYSRDLGARTRLDAMATRQRARLEEAEDAVEDGEQERFRAHADSGETIGRVELAHTRSDALSLNASLEAAVNFLHGDARLEEDGVEVALPGSRVRVEERRAQAAFGLAWQPQPAWTLEAGMRLERSVLAQSNPDGNDRSRSFVQPKPRVAVRWTPGDADEWRLAVSREVGQLEFEDFVASASLENGTVSAGNAALRPDRTWRAVLGWEHRFGADTALTLDWTHERIDGVVDRVLVVDGDELFDAPGNIGDGRRDTLAADLALSLESLGLRGARLRATALWRGSVVADPVTGERRRISGEQPFEGEIELVQELPALRMHWGIQVEHIAERETEYRYDRITRESEDAGWTLFAEKRFGSHWRLRAELTDLFGREFEESRVDYAGTRAGGSVEERTLRRRRTPGTISVTIRRSTGG